VKATAAGPIPRLHQRCVIFVKTLSYRDAIVSSAIPVLREISMAMACGRRRPEERQQFHSVVECSPKSLPAGLDDGQKLSSGHRRTMASTTFVHAPFIQFTFSAHGIDFAGCGTNSGRDAPVARDGKVLVEKRWCTRHSALIAVRDRSARCKRSADLGGPAAILCR